VLFDKIAFVYFIRKIYFYILHRKWPAQGTSNVPFVSAHFRSVSVFCNHGHTMHRFKLEAWDMEQTDGWTDGQIAAKYGAW